MNTLLAKEMLNETSRPGKKRSPSIVAKLMGLDALPSPHPIFRQQSEFSDNSHRTTAKRTEKSFRHDQFYKKTTTEQQYFKDVYEDPQVIAKRRSTKLELGYIKERCDEMIRESIAIKTKLERVDSSPDLMLRFLHNDRQDIPFASVCNEIIVLKPSDASRYGSSGRVLKETVNCRVPISHQRNENGHLGYSCHSDNNSRGSSRYRLERKDATAISPTEIVVLKANVANIYSDKRFLDSADECRKNAELDFYGGEVRRSRHSFKETRDIARRITSRMKDGSESRHAHMYDSSESEMMAISSRNSFHQSVRSRRSYSNMSESVVIKEAKKRMSQRWETNGYKDVGMVGRSSTLEEMLSVPNNETRTHSRTGYLMGPYGISDGDGWRDGYQRSKPRSESLPPFRNRSQKMSDYDEAHADEKPKVYDRYIYRAKSKVVKGHTSDREDSRFKTLQYSERCHTCHRRNACSPEFDNILPTGTYFENKVPAEQESLISDILDVTANAASGIDVCMLGDAISSAADAVSLNSQEPVAANSQGTVSLQLSGTKPESCEGSKEFDQHGQTSVLEVPPTEDLSSGSDSFERVSSQLHELRKQLHWLKMESETTYDSPNDEDIEQRSSSCTVSESENLESTYLSDLLQHSDFYDHDPYTFITKWYSADHRHPIDPRLSDHLEKKHSQVSRPERKLFHDRLNEAMFLLSKTMISWSFGQAGTRMTLTEIGFKDRLQKLLDKQEKEANREFEDMSIDSDLDWFKPVNETEFVGKQIAEVLVNELVLEIFSVSL